MSASSLGHFSLCQLLPQTSRYSVAWMGHLPRNCYPTGCSLLVCICICEGWGLRRVCLKQLILKNNPAGGLIMCLEERNLSKKKKKLRSWPLSCPTPCLIFSFGNSQMTHSGCFDKTFSCFFPPNPQASVIWFLFPPLPGSRCALVAICSIPSPCLFIFYTIPLHTLPSAKWIF